MSFLSGIFSIIFEKIKFKTKLFTFVSNIDSLDWKDYGVDSIINTVLNHKDLKNGAIILMHNGAKYTAQALPKVIEGLQAKGFEIVPISQLIYKDNYHMEHDGSQVCDDLAENNSSQNQPTNNEETVTQ